MTWGYYRRKPVSVQAVQWDAAMAAKDPSASDLHITFHGSIPHSHLCVVSGRLQVVTSAGTVMASHGDWVLWSSKEKELSVVREADFHHQYDVDERASRIFGWREHPKVRPTNKLRPG